MRDIPIEEALDAIPVAVFLIRPGRRISFANTAARELFGEIPADVPFVRVLRHPDCLSLVDAALRKQESGTTEFTVQATQPITYRAEVTPVSGHVMLCLQDISGEVAAESIRSEFVANVSHELRSPLTSVLGFIETLSERLDADVEERARYLEIMHVEAARMNRLVGDLLSLSRIESEERVRPAEPVEIAGLLRQLCAVLSPKAAATGRELILDCPAELNGLVISADPDQLTQVFDNLIENALAYGGTSDVTVAVARADSAPGVEGQVVCVSVSDQGPGIAPEHMARLTERFYRVDAGRSRSLGGTGLGLAIVKHIVARHRGRLQIESRIGEGAVFKVILPAN